jgi:hypothetical protein
MNSINDSIALQHRRPSLPVVKSSCGHVVLFELSGYPFYRPTQGRRKSVGENRPTGFEVLRLSIARKCVK